MIESLLEKELYRSEKPLSENAIRSRISHGRKAERILDYSFDRAVSTDAMMYESLCMLKGRDKGGTLQNVLRWYYKAKNKKAFPRLRDYELFTGLESPSSI